MSPMHVSRRGFLVGGATVVGGLALGVYFTQSKSPLPGASSGALQPNAWLQITPDNQVVFQLDKAEMGQGVFTSMPTIVAEELGIDPREIRVEQAPVHEQFQDPIQITGGSTSTNTRWDILRRTGAVAREMLIAAAAAKWGIPADECHAQQGRVHHKSSSRSLTFGELATSAATMPMPEEPRLKQPSEYSYIGQPLRRFDGVDKVTGAAIYGLDVSLPGMLNASLVRNPYIGGAIAQMDLSRAKSAPGVVDAFAISSGIAVVADTYWHAREAAQLVEVEWDKGAIAPGLDSASIRAAWVRMIRQEDGRVAHAAGNIQEAFEFATDVHEAVYETPYLAHATMEPQNATALFNGEECEVWAPSQSAQLVQTMISQALDLSPGRIRVHTTMLGGGFGRRAFPDFAVDAAEVARMLPKHPVKVIWSREDDTRHDRYRPASYNVLRAALDETGMVQGWAHKMVGPSILSQLLPYAASLAPGWIPDWLAGGLAGTAAWMLEDRDPTTHEGAAENPYGIAHFEARHIYHDPGIPIGFWRSVGHSHNAFITESFIDELAHKAEEDPYKFRRRLLGERRHAQVLNLAAEKAGWGKPRSGLHQGIAVHESFGSVVAEVAEIRMVGGKPEVERVVCAVNCGRTVNPDLVKAQMESGIIFGLSAAMKSGVQIREGAVVESNFHDYQLLRMAEAPDIEVYILDSSAPPTGVGEPGTPPIAPAVGNAIFAATGKRLRKLPFVLS